MRNFEDTYRHKGMRKKLLDSLKEKGIEDERILTAMMNIPRHWFLDTAFEQIAYQDKAFQIAAGQTISQPYTVAYQTQLLEVKPYDKILEVGTGSVFQASVLAEMGAKVYTIERQRELFENNKKFVLKSKYPNIYFFYGDGFEGLPTYAPFHKILITAAAPVLPEKLVAQLKPGGLMVIPLNDEDNDLQIMMRFTKNADGTLKEERFSKFSFVPMLKGRN
ncbi:MAG: protein-L-isoaspartate(D-aspartate) O-methyltransferase [Ginsengibacter sp.]